MLEDLKKLQKRMIEQRRQSSLNIENPIFTSGMNSGELTASPLAGLLDWKGGGKRQSHLISTPLHEKLPLSTPSRRMTHHGEPVQAWREDASSYKINLPPPSDSSESNSPANEPFKRGFVTGVPIIALKEAEPEEEESRFQSRVGSPFYRRPREDEEEEKSRLPKRKSVFEDRTHLHLDTLERLKQSFMSQFEKDITQLNLDEMEEVIMENRTHRNQQSAHLDHSYVSGSIAAAPLDACGTG